MLIKTHKRTMFICSLLFLFATVLCMCGRDVTDVEVLEASAIHALREFAEIENQWKSRDIDRNEKNDFWTGDISGLYRIADKNGNPVSMIFKGHAKADIYPLPSDAHHYLTSELTKQPEPKSGYFFRVMKTDENGNPYQQDGYVNGSKFAFLAVPTVYYLGDYRTFIINQDGKVYGKKIPLPPIKNFNNIPVELLKWPTPTPILTGWFLVPATDSGGLSRQRGGKDKK